MLAYKISACEVHVCIILRKPTEALKKSIANHRVEDWEANNGHTNKANLRDLIAATGLAILLKFDPNH